MTLDRGAGTRIDERNYTFSLDFVDDAISRLSLSYWISHIPFVCGKSRDSMEHMEGMGLELNAVPLISVNYFPDHSPCGCGPSSSATAAGCWLTRNPAWACSGVLLCPPSQNPRDVEIDLVCCGEGLRVSTCHLPLFFLYDRLVYCLPASPVAW